MIELNITLVIQLVIFLSLYFILSPLLFKPLLALFDERENRIEGAAKEAEALKANASGASEEIEAKMAKAHLEARDVLASVKTEAQKIEAEMLLKAQKESQTKLDAFREEMFVNVESARGQLKQDAQDIAQEIVKKMIGHKA